MTEPLITGKSTPIKESDIDHCNVEVSVTEFVEHPKELINPKENPVVHSSDSSNYLINLSTRNEDIVDLNEDKNIDDILPCSTEQLCEDKNLIQTESRSMANTDENLLNCNVELKDDQPTVSAVLDRDGYIEHQLKSNLANELLDSDQKIDTLEAAANMNVDDTHTEKEADIVEHLDSSLLYQNPIFAEICSFFNTFTHLLGLKPMPIAKLDKILCTLINGDVDSELIDLHVTLMRKIYLKSARSDKWEKALQKFSAICPGLDNESRHLQRHHYVDVSIDTKLSLLKALCDSQFECNVKFKESISNTFRNCELRIAPFGRDKCGLIYYVQIDCDLDLRVYTEEPEDEAGTSWTLRARNEAGLMELLTSLKRPDFGTISAKGQIDDDVGEIDEEQILDSPKSMSNKILFSGSATDANLPDMKTKSVADFSIEKQFKLDEGQYNEIALQNKFEVIVDRYRKPELLNNRKSEREQRKKERSSLAITVEKSLKTDKDELNMTKKENSGRDKKNEYNVQGQVETNKLSSEENVSNATNEIDDALIAAELDAEDKRRILPHRSSRNVAISNIKRFTCSPRLSSTIDSSDSAISTFKHKLAFVSTAGINSDENSDEEDLDDIDDESNENSSDDDFLLDSDEYPTSRKIGIPPTKRKLTMKKVSQKRPTRGGKRNYRARQMAALHCASIAIAAANRKKLSSFAIDESSEEEEIDPSIEETEKKKKIATELTLCKKCKGSNRPDLLLLCDNCDDAWHTFCLHPQLWYVPDGDWFCPPCEHNSLIDRFIYVLLMLRDEKNKYEQQKKKEAAADRLKREMDYIGISLNNIIPSGIKDEQQNNVSSSEELDEGSGEYLQRKSKKHAMKMVTAKSRLQRRAIEQFCPVLTVAEGRSRRASKKVDYNFRSYDEQLQEAMFSIDPDAKLNENEHLNNESYGEYVQPNYKNIPDDENQQNTRRKSDFIDNKKKSIMLSRDLDASARPPKGKLQKGKVGRKNKRLTDLDADDITDSDTDEWHESSADNVEEDPEPSEDEYLPSERRSKTRGMWSRHKSDDDFINDDSDPDYIDIGRNRGKKKNRRVSKAMNKRRNETSTSEDDNQIQHDMSDSDSVKSGRKSNKNKAVYSSDEKEMTETGRPLRKAAAKVGARLVEQSVDDEEDEEEEMDENDEKAHEAKSLKNETEDLNNGESILKSKTDFSHLTTHELDGLDENALIDDEEEFMPDEMEEVEADEEEEEAEVELENEAVDDENFEDESGDEDSSVSSDDGEEEEELTNKISKNEKIIQSSTKGKEKKLPPPRKTKRNKKVRSIIKKVGRVKGKTNKISNDKKIGLAREKITTSIQQTISHSPSKNIIDKNAIVSNTECLKSTLSDSQQLSSQHLTRQRYNPSTLIETKMSKFTNSDQQNSLESPTTSSNAEQQRIPSQSRKIELPLSIASSDVSKVQKKEFNISDSLLSNYVSSDRVIAIGKAKVNDISVDSTNSQIKTIEISTKSKLESFVKEKSLPIMDKITVSASYPMNSSKSIPTSDVAALNIPLTSSKMSTTVFQPVNPQQLSQYFLCPSNTPSTSQKIDSTIHVSSSSPVVTSANLTTVLPTRIILQQRPMAPFITTSFPFFSNNTPPNVSSPQVAIMPSILPPQPITGGPTGCLSQFVPQQSTAYFMHQGAPPQVIYQTLQPYGTGLPQHVTFPTNQMQSHQINSQQTAGILDQESLSHALAGAMNPEDL